MGGEGARGVADPRRGRPAGGQASLDELALELERVLTDVQAAVEDWQAMRERLGEIVAELDESLPPVDADELAEARGAARVDGRRSLPVPRLPRVRAASGGRRGRALVRSGSGLGILRETEQKLVSRSFAQLPPEARQQARAPNLLNLTKANSRATVHRSSYLDYVGVKRFDAEGAVLGERRFLGLYTHTAYRASPWEIPVLRRKAQRVVDRSGFVPRGHDYKALVEILESYPRDELFQIDEDELFDTALAVLHLGERRRLRLFVRRDAFGRFLSCLVYLPLERYNTDVRRRVEQILLDAFGGTSVDFNARVSESVLARLHVVVRTDPGADRDYDVAAIEARLAEATRTWSDDLYDAMIEQLGEERASSLYRRYGNAFHPRTRPTSARTPPWPTSRGSSGSTPKWAWT